MLLRLVIAAGVFAAALPIAQRLGAQTTSDPIADQTVGKRFLVTVDQLPPPESQSGVSNPPLVVPRADHKPNVPEGFKVTLFAEGLENPRRLLVLPNGDVLVALQKSGRLMILRDADGDGRAERIEQFAGGFDQPYGLAYREGEILVADQIGIWRLPYTVGRMRSAPEGARPSNEVPPEPRKPSPNMDGPSLLTARSVFGVAAGHRNRDLAIGPDGRLYVGVGSVGNIDVEPSPKATIQSFSPDGKDQRTVAAGLRNPTALAFHPRTGALWTVVEERDGMGDELVPDYLTQVQFGGFYGWPYAYIGPHPQPDFAQRAPDKVQHTLVPDLLFEAHSSALDVLFYDGDMFPESYRGDAFVALKGSWNRRDPTGYKVVRVPFENGAPKGGYENFATGFWVAGSERAQTWGRPAALAVAHDGALLVADDTGGTIWRISYVGRG
ncbi:MAG TPA: PQQ-dependent sugar dehydrogenase [Burkholderiales bacterium]|nr:PQQ-dependent sugar dehydrogenase [Burkholderiales bacterium]